MKPRVSDHALLRFIQRAGGFDVEGLRWRIEASLERAATAAAALGQETFTIQADGLIYIVKAGVVVTVVDEEAQRGLPVTVRR